MNTLGLHLARLNLDTNGDGASARIAAGIAADPQGHVDALVEAGLLRTHTGTDFDIGTWEHITTYSVVKQPHEHEWGSKEVGLDGEDGKPVKWCCRICGLQSTTVAKKPEGDG